MKKIILATFVLLAGFGTLAQAKNVYAPAKGIICDKKSHFCVDSHGISMGLTKEYLGNRAVAKLQMIIDSVHGDMDMTSFTFSNGLSCDTNKKICKKSKWDDKADPYWTAVLFPKGYHNR